MLSNCSKQQFSITTLDTTCYSSMCHFGIVHTLQLDHQLNNRNHLVMLLLTDRFGIYINFRYCSLVIIVTYFFVIQVVIHFKQCFEKFFLYWLDRISELDTFLVTRSHCINLPVYAFFTRPF